MMCGVPGRQGHLPVAGAVGPGPSCGTPQGLRSALCENSAHPPGCQDSEGDSLLSGAEPVAATK